MKYTIEKSDDFFLYNTEIENLFINEYMASAPGDYVKVYIFASMCSQHDMTVEIKAMASTLGMTEDKVIKAWEYWEQMGAIRRRYIDQAGDLEFSVEFLKLKNHFYGIGLYISDKESDKTSSAEEGINVFGNQAIKELIQHIEKISGKEMSTYGLDAVIKLVDQRKANPEMIKFAADYSINKNKSSSRYIVKVAENWLDKGINTKEDAVAHVQEHDSRYFLYKTVIQALYGFVRPANMAEKAMMNRWFDEEGFSLERVLEACNKTTGIREPNFNYVDAVLRGWKEDEKLAEKDENTVTQGTLVRYLEEIRQQADEEAQARKEDLLRRLPEFKDIEKQLQQAYRNRILRGRKGSVGTKEEYDKLIEDLKAERRNILEKEGLDESYFLPKRKCNICGDTCETEEGVCLCKPLRIEEAKEWIKK